LQSLGYFLTRLYATRIFLIDNQKVCQVYLISPVHRTQSIDRRIQVGFSEISRDKTLFETFML